VEAIDEHASFYWGTIYTKIGFGVQGIIKVMSVGPGTSSLKLWTQTRN
jgi:hypothetical protein